MNKSFYLLLLLAMFILSCKKSTSTVAPTQKSNTAGILLTTITDNITGDPNKGKDVAEFTYNGTQLTKAIYYDYSQPPTVVETDIFNYDSTGKLTGTTITNSQPTLYPDVKTIITYNGTNISEITYYKANNVFESDFKFTYSNNQLTSYINLYSYGTNNRADTTYISYDSNGHATKFWDGHPKDNALTFLTFDTNSSFSNSVPFWAYFFTTPMYVPGMWVSPGLNNAINYNYYNQGNYSYSYQYNSNGFPSSMASTAPYSFSLNGVQKNANEVYLYQYMKVN